VRRHWLPALVLLPFVLLMILFQLAPMVWVLVGSQTPMAGASTTTGRF
jgi:putative spermidine/putrescine transport system permease protein